MSRVWNESFIRWISWVVGARCARRVLGNGLGEPFIIADWLQFGDRGRLRADALVRRCVATRGFVVPSFWRWSFRRKPESIFDFRSRLACIGWALAHRFAF